jgi:FkbM family methyltransferase
MSATTEYRESIRHDWGWRGVKRALKPISPQWLLNWREKRFFEKFGEVELQLLDILCDPARDSLDVGANDGSFVHFLRSRSKTVHAFEPMPEQIATLHRKFRGGNVVVHPIALSREAGTIELHLPVMDGVVVHGCATVATDAAAGYPSRHSVSVRMDTLDSVYGGNVGFIKIDVEGHQQAVLDGASETFRRCRPRVLIEIIEEMSPGGLGQATGFFDPLGYRGYFIHQGDLHPIAEFAPQVLQRPENRPSLLAHPAEDRGAYLYNFIFLPRESLDDDLARIRHRLSAMGGRH